MKITRMLLVPAILLGLACEIFSSNPDSEIVQSSSDKRYSGERMAVDPNAERTQGRSVGDLDLSFPEITRVRVLPPVIPPGSRITWRQVGVTQNVIKRIRDRDRIAVWRRNNPPNLLVPDGDNDSNGANDRKPVGGNAPQSPPDNARNSYDNVPEVPKAENSDIFASVPFNSVGNRPPVSVQNERNKDQLPTRPGNPSGFQSSFNEQNPNGLPPNFNRQNPSRLPPSTFNEQNPRVSPSNFNGQNPTGFQSNFNGQNPSAFSTNFNGQNPGDSQPNFNNPSDLQPNFGGQQPNFNDNTRSFGYVPNNRGLSRNSTAGVNYGERPVPFAPQNPSTVRGRPSSNVPGYVPSGTNKRVSPDSNLFASIVNDFAFKLEQNLNMETNFVISPLSIFVALSMCYLGSEGNTKAQLERVLGLNINAIHEERFHQGIKDLMLMIMPKYSEYQLFVANGMFLGQDFPSEVEFEQNIRKYYAAELRNLNYANPQLSMSVINDWVARSTRNVITNFIDSPPSALTRLILLNAIYFKGIWKMQFPSNLTHNSVFHSIDGTEKEVPTMRLFAETFPLFRSDDHRHTFIKIPYKGDQVSMIIALPYTEFEKPMPSVTDKTLCHIRDALTSTKLDVVSIPKFKLEFAASLREPLTQLGISDIFNRNVVDLRKLRKQNDVYVSAILHKAVVDVNEEGTTASASTSVRFVGLTFRNSTNFIADHPFAFYIVHEPSGLVLFYGKIFDLGIKTSPNSGRNNGRFNPRPNSEMVSRNPSRIRLHGAVNYENVD